MSRATTPLFATECFGVVISHVQVFPTYVTYRQKFGPDISVALDMIASIEERVYENGFVILRTTTRRRIICMVQPNRAAALCVAIRDAQHRFSSARDNARKTPLGLPVVEGEGIETKPHSSKIAVSETP